MSAVDDPTGGGLIQHTHTNTPLGIADGVVGPYRTLQPLGEGGMGEVWLAEQSKPVRRHVALKLIKPGMDTAQVIARFEAERQALAVMDHPGIAKVFDAGITPQGRSYFAMEYVRGEPLTQYCDRQRLTVEERLELFIQICEAVQHAHQKGIIHRDLKPSNILVVTQDDRPAPKVIDFGVAKAMTGGLTDRTLFTALAGFVGTPGYMSPEQTGSGGVDIDTRTDVYALGVVLYELLTGILPFDAGLFRQKTADEIRRTILEVEPPRPSTRVTEVTAETSRAAANRRTDPVRLKSALQGDLDWITMRALEKDRARRYGSVSDLAAEIRRHLTNQPVLAGPPSAVYRTGKFVRRHRFGVAVSVAALLMLVAFGTATALQARRIARERDRANHEARRANLEAAAATQVADFLVSLFRISDPNEARGAALTARDVLDRGADRLNKELVDQPELRSRLMSTIANVYGELGLRKDSLALWERVLAIRRTSLGDTHPLTYSAHMGLGNTLNALNRPAEARPHLEAAFEGFKKLAGLASEDTLKALNNLAVLEFTAGRMQESEARLRLIVEGRTALYGTDDTRTISAKSNLAAAMHSQEKWDEASATYGEVLSARRRLLGNDHPHTLRALANLGELARQRGRLDEAEGYYAEALPGRRRVLPASHTDLALTLSYYGDLRNAQRRPAEAERMLRESVSIYRAALPSGSPMVFLAESRLGESLILQRRFKEAEPLLVRAADQILPGPELMKLERRAAAQRVIDLYEQWGNLEQAAAWKQRLVSASLDDTASR